jgi:hypothetical protein
MVFPVGGGPPLPSWALALLTAGLAGLLVYLVATDESWRWILLAAIGVIAGLTGLGFDAAERMQRRPDERIRAWQREWSK